MDHLIDILFDFIVNGSIEMLPNKKFLNGLERLFCHSYRCYIGYHSSWNDIIKTIVIG